MNDDMSYLHSWLNRLTPREQYVLLQTKKIKNPKNFSILKQYLKNIAKGEDEEREIIAVDEEKVSDIEIE